MSTDRQMIGRDTLAILCGLLRDREVQYKRPFSETADGVMIIGGPRLTSPEFEAGVQEMTVSTGYPPDASAISGLHLWAWRRTEDGWRLRHLGETDEAGRLSYQGMQPGEAWRLGASLAQDGVHRLAAPESEEELRLVPDADGWRCVDGPELTAAEAGWYELPLAVSLPSPVADAVWDMIRNCSPKAAAVSAAVLNKIRWTEPSRAVCCASWAGSGAPRQETELAEDQYSVKDNVLRITVPASEIKYGVVRVFLRHRDPQGGLDNLAATFLLPVPRSRSGRLRLAEADLCPYAKDIPQQHVECDIQAAASDAQILKWFPAAEVKRLLDQEIVKRDPSLQDDIKRLLDLLGEANEPMEEW